MKRIIWVSAVVLATLSVLALAWQFSEAVVLFLFSLAVAAAFRPRVQAMQKRGLPKGLALGFSFGSTLLIVAAFLLLLSGPLLNNVQRAVDDSLAAYDDIKGRWLEDPSPVLNNLAEQMPPSKTLYTALTGDQSSMVLGTLFGAAQGTFGFLSSAVMVLVLSIYWSADEVHFERLWLSLLPVESRARARAIWQKVQSSVGDYLRREALLSLTAASLLWVGYLLLGVHYAALLALIAAFARLIPWLGVMLVLFLPLLAGSSLGLWAALTALALTLVVLVGLEKTLGDRYFPRGRYSSLLLVLLIIALADSFGLLGAVFAPILAVTLQSLLGNLLSSQTNRSGGVTVQSLARLQQKMEQVHRLAQDEEEPASLESLSLAERLERLVDKTAVMAQPQESSHP